MRFATCLGLLVGLAGCNGGGPVRVGDPTPEATTNRLVVNLDEDTKISVRQSGAILWNKGTPARIDDRGRVTDRWGKLLAWLHEDNIRIAGGALIPIRKGLKQDLFLSHKAQRDAGLQVLEARIGEDGGIAAGEGRVATMTIEGNSTPANRRLALLLLLLLQNDMLGDSSGTPGAQSPDDQADEPAGEDDEPTMKFADPDEL